MARAGYCRHNRPYNSFIGCWECEQEEQQRQARIEADRKASVHARVLDGLIAFAGGFEDVEDMTHEELDEALRKEGIDPERLARKTRLVLQIIKSAPRWNEATESTTQTPALENTDSNPATQAPIQTKSHAKNEDSRDV